MVPSKTFLSLIFFAPSVVNGSPLTRHTGKASLSFATKISDRGTLNIAEKDRARVQAMKQMAQLGKRSTSVNITNTMFIYTTQVGVGDLRASAAVVDAGLSDPRHAPD